MLRLEYAVPHIKLIQHRDSGPVVVGDIRAPVQESGYGTRKIMGVKDMTIKYGAGFISCDISFPVHQSMLQDIHLDKYGDMHELFSLKHNWTVEFGWSNVEGTSFILSGMKLADVGMEYDQELRSFIAKFKLIPRHNYVLADIPLSMLNKELDEIEAKKSNPKWGHSKSIGSVITAILEGCERVLGAKIISDDNSKTFRNVDLYTKEVTRIPQPSQNDNLIYGEGLVPEGYREVEMEEDDKGLTKAQWEAKAKSYVSKTFIFGNASDIPKASEIRLLLFDVQGASVKMAAAATEFNSMPMPIQTTLQKGLSGRKNYDMSALQFITGILNDNGFNLMPMPYTVNQDGKMAWMIIQTDFNNIGSALEEEFIGINRVTKTAASTLQIAKFVNTFGAETTEEKSLFDLHSNRNVVISIDASIGGGRSTYATALAAEDLANAANAEPPGDNIVAYRNSVLGLLAKEAHELNLEIFGMPEIRINDNIIVYLAGEIYSGKYKIIEMEHKIDGGFTTSLRAIRMSSSTKLNSGDQKGIVIHFREIGEVTVDPGPGVVGFAEPDATRVSF